MSAPSGRSPFHRTSGISGGGSTTGTGGSNNRNSSRQSTNTNGYNNNIDSFGSSSIAAAAASTASPSLLLGNSRLSLGMMSSSHHYDHRQHQQHQHNLLGLSSSLDTNHRQQQSSGFDLSMSTSFSGAGGASNRNSYYSNSLLSMSGATSNDNNDMMITPSGRQQQQHNQHVGATTTNTSSSNNASLSSPFWNPHLPLNPKGIDLSGVSSRVVQRNNNGNGNGNIKKNNNYNKKYNDNINGLQYDNDDIDIDQEDEDQKQQQQTESNNNTNCNINNNVDTTSKSIYMESNIKHNNNTQQKNQKLLNNEEKIRKIAKKSIQTVTSSEIATFYSSILWSKTQKPKDALLYAKALLLNDEPKRAISILTNSNLLFLNSSLSISSNNNKCNNMIISSRLYIEASLLACKCLCLVGEYTDACTVIENVCRYPLDYNNNMIMQSSSQIIQHADDPRLLMLAKLISNSSSEEQDYDNDDDDIHPIARLCYTRGKIYDILSNTNKSISFLKIALKIDQKCINAFTYIMERNLVCKYDLYNFISNELKFNNDDGNDDNWLKDFYYAHFIDVIVSNNNDHIDDHDDDLEKHHQQQQQQFEYGTVKKRQQHHPSVHIPDQSSIYPTYTPSPRHLHHALTPPTNLLASLPPSTSPPLPPPPPPPSSHRPISSVTKTPSNNNQHDIKSSSSSHHPLTIFHRLYYTHNLQRNTQILTLAAQSAYEHYHTKLAAQLCSYIHTIDQHCPSAAFIHAASLLSLSHKRLLYHLGHKLVQSNPRLPQSWFVIGCYYHLCQKYDIAQRHFCRATRLDPRCAYAWIAFGCAFAAADESDQALGSFRAAQRLNPSSHIPFLYIGMEYLRTNHLTLSYHFLSSSVDLNPYDPLPLNELGVVAYRHGEYSNAIDLFLKALSLHIANYYHNNMPTSSLPSFGLNSNSNNDSPPLPYHLSSSSLIDENISSIDNLSPEEIITLTADEFWEPTLFNLGQSLRKMKNYSLSILSFKQAISLKPNNNVSIATANTNTTSPATLASSYAALAFTQHCSNDIHNAIDNYHKALSMQPDHAFSMEMLHRALEEITSVNDNAFIDSIFPFEEDNNAFSLNMDMDNNDNNNSCSNSTTNIKRLQKLTIQNNSTTTTKTKNHRKNDDYDSDDHELNIRSNINSASSSSGMEDESVSGSSNFSLDVSMMS